MGRAPRRPPPRRPGRGHRRRAALGPGASAVRALWPWLDLIRVGNLPTVWTNVLAGAVCGAAAGGGPIHPPSVALAAVAGSCAYAAGMALNDVADARRDRAEKPRRPIAAGALPRRSAAALASACAIAGPGVAYLAGGALAGALLGVILLLAALYNALHARSAWAIAALALCRGLLYPLGAIAGAAASDGTILATRAGVWVPAAGVAAYTALLSIAARREDRPGARVPAWLALSVGVPAVAGAAWLVVGAQARTPAMAWLWGGAALLALVVWMARTAAVATATAPLRSPGPPRTVRAVMSWLAGLSLADALMIGAAGSPLVALAWLGFAVVVALHRRFLGS
ncbi:MAG: hypothetical protein C0475_02320 [Planctomyces sp.]|nr:hypothetical protein [Planctomyces sp.]MBA4120598.1 hypothetical protein [Isosphaera sp.]